MQWIDNQKLRQISGRINSLDLADLRLDCKLELFNTIIINNNIPLPIEKNLNNEIMTSPHLLKSSPLGPLSALHSRQLLVILIGVLNETFPDYQFNTLSPEHFVKKEDPGEVVSEVNQYFGTSLDLAQPGLVAELWGAVQSCISFIDTDVYELVDDLSLLTAADDDSGSHLWQFHYFFNDNKHKRLLLFAVKATSRYVHGHTTGSEGEDDYNMLSRGTSRQDLLSSSSSREGGGRRRREVVGVNGDSGGGYYYNSDDNESDDRSINNNKGDSIKRISRNRHAIQSQGGGDDDESSIWSLTSREDITMDDYASSNASSGDNNNSEFY